VIRYGHGCPADPDRLWAALAAVGEHEAELAEAVQRIATDMRVRPPQLTRALHEWYDAELRAARELVTRGDTLPPALMVIQDALRDERTRERLRAAGLPDRLCDALSTISVIPADWLRDHRPNSG
jgi:hypothetical protein